MRNDYCRRFGAPPAFRRAAQRARIASASLRRPSGVIPPLRDADDFVDAAAGVAEALPPFCFAQRAFAAAASFARVAADIGLRRRSPPPLVVLLLVAERLLLLEEDCDPPPNKELIRSSNALICSRNDTASLSFSRDRSMALSNLPAAWRN